MGKITVVVKEPQKPAEKRVIENDLEASQEIVGGFIEQIHLPDTSYRVPGFDEVFTLKFPEISLIFNEEGRLMDPPLEPNISTPEFLGGSILGPLFACRVDTVGDFASLQESEITSVVDALNMRAII